MDTVEQIKARIEQAVPGAALELVPNDSPANQPSLAVPPACALAVARFLREAPGLRLDYASNVTGVDWPDRTVQEKVRTRKVVQGEDREFEEVHERTLPGYLEVVYHLYSMELKQGLLVLRQRTGNRADQVTVASLTPVWRSCELQEREVFDLFGLRFEGHPDLRRILMWEEFTDHPMRKDYVEPDDYDYEPTAHGQVLEKTRQHHSEGAGGGREASR